MAFVLVLQYADDCPSVFGPFETRDKASDFWVELEHDDNVEHDVVELYSPV